jgi:hypothetical protein
MASKIYESGNIRLIDGKEVYITPLKIKYLRQFMDVFQNIKAAESEDESMTYLLECARIAMQQYYPKIKTIYDVEDNLDIKNLYLLLDYSAGIKMKEDSEKTAKEQAETSDNGWDNLKLHELESELFLLGIWKDYEELESSLSMPEIVATLNSKREGDYAEKKFLAAIQGIDLDKQSGKQNEWEELKARVFSKGKASNANDVLALQGVNAQKAGFGIGMGLGYERIESKK